MVNFAAAVCRRLFAEKLLFNEANALLKARDVDAETIRTRLPDFLTSRSWQVRNVGVKLIAKLRDPRFYPFLVSKIRNRGDVGIINRNAVTKVIELGLNTAEVEYALRRALRAKYWEVKCEAIRALAELFDPSDEREELIVGMLKPAPNIQKPRRFRQKNFEIRSAVTMALGRVGRPETALPLLAILAEDNHWMVRNQAAVGLVEMSRRQPHIRHDAANVLGKIDMLSDGCRSDFPFPRTMRSLHEILLNGLESTDPQLIRANYINMTRGWNRKL